MYKIEFITFGVMIVVGNSVLVVVDAEFGAALDVGAVAAVDAVLVALAKQLPHVVVLGVVVAPAAAVDVAVPAVVAVGVVVAGLVADVVVAAADEPGAVPAAVPADVVAAY